MLETQEMWVQSLHQEDPLEEEMATHSSIHAWKIPWTEEPGGHCPASHKDSDTNEHTGIPCALVDAGLTEYLILSRHCHVGDSQF